MKFKPRLLCYADECLQTPKSRHRYAHVCERISSPLRPAPVLLTRSAIGRCPPAGSGKRVARGHQAPAFGVVCKALGVEEREATRAFMYLVARDVLSAATRYKASRVRDEVAFAFLPTHS